MQYFYINLTPQPPIWGASKTLFHVLGIEEIPLHNSRRIVHLYGDALKALYPPNWGQGG
jgi:hypothetical protein